MDRRRTFWALVLPPGLWLVVFLLVPLTLMAAFSSRGDMRGGILRAWTPTAEQYQVLLETGSYVRLLVVSAGMALLVAVIATLLAYPIAYFLAFRAGRRAPTYLLLLLIPFWTSYLLRVMAWKLILGSGGALNSLMLGLGLIAEPLRFFFYNRGAVVLTLIYVWIPFAALPMYAALLRVDSSILEAAFDLGAPPVRRFLRIVLPLSLPGVVAAFFMVFIPTVGEYVTPLLIGGSSGSMYGNIIQDFFTKAANWPLGSALAMVMLVATLLAVALAAILVDVRRLVDI
ncbi:MAG TPA: ABC transporter permease [Anaerolineales bacterium]|nr:ABC transporter permease [Anaerolineales bacterium]